ncbi:methyltransferase family protein [Motilibacter rhizosphaerae]|uniref:Methyltransferase family protein n=1 Tax=Motilibacter rhizosphaerae TaxID=598652 RepID=A0A4Q7NWP3_9ACTN|nr:class I SAM-dependent methyltransferase [Motilibacter rhizosphaerae]RZS90832.1 methyltransferase family protein [Motilibacter rhizosphaerae]
MRLSGLAATFDTMAEGYDAARPGYPDALFADLAGIAGLGPGSRVLEIGAGTGQATRGLLARGWRVRALEPGPALAAVLRRNLGDHPALEVVEATFEEDEPDEPVDLVVAATAWHWLDPATAYGRAATLLRPGGSLAVIATEHVLPADGDLFFRDVEELYDEVGLGDGKGGPQPPDSIEPPQQEALRSSTSFDEPVVRRYVQGVDYTADAYVAVLETYSGHIAASPEQRERLFAGIRQRIAARPEGLVRKHYLNLLQVARRR